MQYPSHLSPEQHLIRLTYLGVLSIAEPLEEFSTWLLTGTAAIIALVVANIASITSVVTEIGLRWGLVLLTISIVSGVVAKQIGIAIRKGVVLIEALYAELQTAEGLTALQSSSMDVDSFAREMSRSFLWPLNHLMEKSARMGAGDAISGERRHIKLFCIQLYASYLQGVLGAAGLLFLAFGIK